METCKDDCGDAFKECKDKDKKKGEGISAGMRKNEAKEKAMNAKNDGGFTTDQRIDMKSVKEEERVVDGKNEVTMVSLSLEESAMAKVIEAVERRAVVFVRDMTKRILWSQGQLAWKI